MGLNHVMGYVFFKIGHNENDIQAKLERTRLLAA